ncbi:leucine-rich repeat domain-containing protein [Microscilla marina]|uniref:Leucine-rich repeat containing protein n=1 Tax=Microscilla marina ATCC 23134 TaxID=313606 RepID=A1ZNQ2_MICM2|nr:hypothetical protein [Microscilla marina]EAY27941.1 leucine-rich repeat containing protein [Microscilla marina ATCC 23134]
MKQPIYPKNIAYSLSNSSTHNESATLKQLRHRGASVELPEKPNPTSKVSHLQRNKPSLTPIITVQMCSSKLKKLPLAVTQCVHAKALILAFNELEALPTEIGNMHNLEYLYLNFNRLKGLPNAIKYASKLKALTLVGNGLQQIPSQAFELHQLCWLDMSFNKISHLPENIGALTKLKTLTLSHNYIRTIPKSIASLAQLKYLSLQGNFLTGKEKEKVNNLLPNTQIKF